MLARTKNMPIKNQTTNTKLIYRFIAGISLWISFTVNAQQVAEVSHNNAQVSVSIGVNKGHVNKENINKGQAYREYRDEKIQLTQNNALLLFAAQSASKPLIRAEKKVKTQEQTKTTQVNKVNSPKKSTNYQHSFSIYDASSYLLDDIDGDGYFQTFSVVFDADLHSASLFDTSEVYAELYLSKNGGPWEHYYSTDSFILYADTDTDEFEVITTLHQGYSSDSYDVLIDLYEVGFTDIVASYSSEDNNALYALPLESAEYEIEYVYEEHGGSSSLSMLLCLLMFSLLVRKHRLVNSL
jgi:hypothetical protein